MLEITNEVTAPGHSFKDKYSKDDSYHWLACNNCDELISLAEHTLGDDYHCTVCNYSFYTSGIIYEISDDGSLSVVGYDGYSPEVVIPSEYQGLPVRSIAESAFSGSGITKVIIPNSVTSIGGKAFFNCTKLRIVSIGDGVTTIGNDAFSGCNKLFFVVNKSQLEITRGSLDHGGIAYNAISVNSINVWLDYVDDYVFVSDNWKIYLVDYEGTGTSLTLPTYYGQYYEILPNAFANRTSIYEVIIPDGVTALGDGCFAGCAELTYLTLGQDIKTIGEGAFDGADNLEYIYVNDLVSFARISISDKTFSGIRFIYENGREVTNPFYNPTVAVIYIVDISGSMFSLGNFEDSRLYYALLGVEVGFQSLGKDDYVGIMYFAEYYTEVLGLTSCAEQDKILAALDQRPTSGGSSYGLSYAISAAGQMLAAFTEADEKHIVIITDGAFYDVEPLGSALQENAYLGILTSIVGIEVSSSDGSHIRDLLTNYAWMTSDYYYEIEIRNENETVEVIRDVMLKITFY